MICLVSEICGGCRFRNLDETAYRQKKITAFEQMLKNIHQENIPQGQPVFIPDGCRRRAGLAFQYRKGSLILGFNEARSENIINITSCSLLTEKLNAVLPDIRQLLTEICAVPFVEGKGKKQKTSYLNTGDVFICEADNGVDVVLEFDKALALEQRMIIFETVQNTNGIIRISHRRKADTFPEPIAEKVKPIINIAGYDIYIPAGTFLQPSKAGEQALTDLVIKYLGTTEGKIADLFCGVGTFSYPLSRNINNKIFAIDSSAELLEGFRTSVNKNMISNITIAAKNLFKYPLDEQELKGFSAIVFDPPRAGAAAQVKKIAEMAEKPEKIIAVSCNPNTFVNDANTLISAGYKISEITLVDQFIYSNHSELVALFTK